MIEYFIDVAKECINIGNFNSLMAIIGECLVQWQNVFVLLFVLVKFHFLKNITCSLLWS